MSELSHQFRLRFEGAKESKMTIIGRISDKREWRKIFCLFYQRELYNRRTAA